LTKEKLESREEKYFHVSTVCWLLYSGIIIWQRAPTGISHKWYKGGKKIENDHKINKLPLWLKKKREI
jgi:hypothetical protein